MRKFHIDEFPIDRIWVLLDKEFHSELFGFLYVNFGFDKLNKKFFNNKLNLNNYKRWQYRIKKPGKKIPQFIPLWFLVKLSKYFSKRFSIKKIEKNVVGYKGPSTSSVIWKPRLPLVENGRLIKMLAHMIGDGHVGGAFGTKLPKGKTHSEYRNYNKGLLDQFIKDIQIFGKVNLSVNYKHGHVIFPNSIGYLLEHIYNIKTNTHVSKVPGQLYNLNKEVIAKFIRAFADDEGHVYDDHIDFYSTNKRLLEGIIKLFGLYFPEIKISFLKVNFSSKNPKYYFYVLSESKEDYLKLIGFDHITKKKDLIFNIKRSKLNKKGGRRGLTKSLMLVYLNNESLSAKQLSRKLFLRHGSILDHLNQLKEQNKVEVIGKGHFNENIWKAI